MRSIGTCHDELYAYICNNSIDILALNETWLNTNSETSPYNINDYNFIHIPREGRRGGGVAFYIRNNATYKVISLPKSGLEQLWISVKYQSQNIVLGTAYRPQSVSVNSAAEILSERFSELACTKDIFVFLGDLNVNLLNNTRDTQKLTEVINSMNLTQIVQEPTRITNKSSSLIDIICTNIPDKLSKVTVNNSHGISDHAIITAEFNLTKLKTITEIRKHRKLNQIHEDTFNNCLRQGPWDLFEKMNNVDELVEKFNAYVISIFDVHCPVTITKVKSNSKPWITDTILFMMKLRNTAYHKYRRTGKPGHLAYYKQLRNLVTSSIKWEKAAFYTYYVNSHVKDSKKLWNGINNTLSFKTRKCDIPQPLNDPDRINSYFRDAGAKGSIDLSLVKYYYANKLPGLDTKLELTQVTRIEVENLIKSIKSNAIGSDGISLSMINRILPYAMNTITRIINLSLSTSTFPTKWKTAIVLPVQKNKDVKTLNDLRPISILPTLSKILEKVVCRQTTTFAELHDLLPATQSGFRRGHGTATALQCVVDDVLASADKGLVTAVALLDFSKAFDSLSINLLLAKLSYMHFSPKVVEWFRSYLTDRTQVTKCTKDGEEIISKPLTMLRGVPQGSVLGPLLFTLYTSDMLKNVKTSQAHMYADDTQVYHSFPPRRVNHGIACLSNELALVADWSRSHSLQLNPTKSKYMLMGQRVQITTAKTCQNTRLTIGGDEIPQFENSKNLGVQMDTNLRFADHINKQSRYCYARLKALYKVREYLTIDVRKLVVEALILSIINYADTAYGPCLHKRERGKVQRIQNACMRFVYKIRPRTRITPYLNQHKILNMEHRRKLHLATQMYNIIQSKRPAYLYNKLQWSGATHAHGTRARNCLLMTPAHRSAAFEGSFRFAATACWNDVPQHIQRATTAPSFKRLLTHHLLDRQIATI